MWNLLLGILVPMAIRMGVDFVVRRFPGMPSWIKDILHRLVEEKKAAATIEEPFVRLAAHRAAKQRAINEVKRRCSGVACPPELKF